jgi:hypothetical protein
MLGICGITTGRIKHRILVEKFFPISIFSIDRPEIEPEPLVVRCHG